MDGCLPETGVHAGDVDVCLARIERDTDDLDSAGEAVSVRGGEAGEELLVCAGDLVEGCEGVSDHGGEVESGGRAIEDDEGLGAVGVEFHEGAQRRWLVLGDEERVHGAKERQEVESRGFESRAKAWSDMVLDGIGDLARGFDGATRHAHDDRQSGPARQEKRAVTPPSASSQDGRAAASRR